MLIPSARLGEGKGSGGVRADLSGVAIMRWSETAYGSLPFACDSKTRWETHAVAQGAFFGYISPCPRNGDRRKIHPFHPARGIGGEAKGYGPQLLITVIRFQLVGID